MPHRPRKDTLTIAASGTSTSSFSMQGTRDLAIDAGTFDTSTKFRLQGSSDGGTTWHDVKDKDLNVLEYAASTGGFILDSDYIARFYTFPLVRITISTAQSGAISFTIFRGREAL